MKFIDEAVISVKAGDGGRGAVSFRREKFAPLGGPDGGNGGAGGDVLLVANTSLSTLLDFKYQPLFKAKAGVHGQNSDKHGAGADDLMVKVPCGTVVHDEETDELLADLVADGETYVAAKGGRGGRGNAAFKSSTNRAPRKAQAGLPGEEARLRLELKLIADVGLVGLPNAGKSTLISRICAARPKIADYPFTTLVPNLGVVRGVGGKGFVVADLPGLIEGASQGHGLGHQFLRHVMRTRVILHLIDCMNEDPIADLETIAAELTAFDPALAERPRIVVVTKTDLAPDPDELEPLRQKLKASGLEVLVISAVSGSGLEDLVARVSALLADVADAPKEEEEVTWTP